MNPTIQYLIVGSGAASAAAAKAIRSTDPSGTILIISQEIHRPYVRPLVVRDYLCQRCDRERLFSFDQRWLTENAVVLRTGRRAAHLDPARRLLILESGEEIAFATLLIATGATPTPLDIPGHDLPGAFHLRTIDDADRLINIIAQAQREGLKHERGRGRCAVIGAGALGVELCATLLELGIAVDLVEKAPRPWSRFAGDAAGHFIAEELQARGVRLHLGAPPLRFEGDGRVQQVILANGGVLRVDFVVVAAGCTPDRRLVRGTPIRAERAILTDERGRISHPDIYAAGECAAIFDPRFGKYRTLDHWGGATLAGTIAGLNMAGTDARLSVHPHDDPGTFHSALFDLTLTAMGEARLADRRIVRANPKGSRRMLEFGIDPDGRIASLVAIGHEPAELDLPRRLVARRARVASKEEQLRDPTAPLEWLLG